MATIYLYDGNGYYLGKGQKGSENPPLSTTIQPPAYDTLSQIPQFKDGAWTIITAPAVIGNTAVNDHYAPLLQNIIFSAIYAWLNDDNAHFNSYKAQFKALYMEYQSKLK